jgi:hypothetical protein
MTIRRKVFVFGFVLAVVLLANAAIIAQWLDDTGIVGLAQAVRHEYLTGTAIAIIAALLILLVPSTFIAKCRVCEQFLLRQGVYCPKCGCRL